MADEAMIAAVTAGIAEASPTPPEPVTEATETETPETETPETPETPETAEGDEAEAEAAATDEPTGETADEPAKEPATDGAEGDAAKPKEGKEPPKPPEPPKQRDPVNDPIPNALKPDTKTRMKALVDIAKTVTGERDKLKSQNEELIGYIQETKATPEQYSQALEFLRLVNSGNPNDAHRALQVMQAEVAALATRLGVAVPGVDFLSQHPDLQQAVQAGTLPLATAQEVAAARAHQAALRNAGAAQDQTAQAQMQHQQAVQRGRSDLDALEAQLRTDPHYAAKRAQLIPILKPVFAQIPPSQWAAAFREAYSKMPNPVAAPAAPRVPTNTPLRPSNPSAAATSPPATMLEAVTAALKQK